LLRGLYHRHYWELPVKEGNVILLVPADLEQALDMEGCGPGPRRWRRDWAIAWKG
jgi:hypothetical protein